VVEAGHKTNEDTEKTQQMKMTEGDLSAERNEVNTYNNVGRIGVGISGLLYECTKPLLTPSLG